jgi:2'-5' RNA ligase
MNQLPLFEEHKETIGKVMYEYFFLISPDWSVKKVVKEMKRKLDSEIGIDKADMHSVPHISLFKIRDASPNIDISKYAEALSKARAFEVNVCGNGLFDQYNGKKTLYLKIKEHETISNIHYALMKCRGYDEDSGFVPHITIARNIAQPKLNNIADVSEYGFMGEFYCDRITVLRKAIYRLDFPLGSFEYYDEIHLLKSTNAFFG